MPKNCPKCESENNDLAKFCKGCGFDFLAVLAAERPVDIGSLICGKCQSSQTPGARFCKSCGAPIVANPPLLVSSPATEVLPEPPAVPLAVAEPVLPALPEPESEPVQPTVALPVQSVAPFQPPVAPPLTTKPVSPSVLEPSTALASTQKKPLSPMVLVSLAMACVGLVGGSYWLMTASTHESSPASTRAVANAPVVVSTPVPKATAVEAVPGSATVPVPAAASTLPGPALIAAPAVTPEAPRASLAPTPVPVSAVKQEPVPAPLPMVGNNSEVEAKPVLKREQRTADEVVMAQRTNRQAIAKQKERDKATLSHTNKTLDDLLK